MNNSLKRITGALLIIAVLPVAFLGYQLTQLNKNEELVREAYQNQLDAILFSINQYSDDVIASWANRIRLAQTNRYDSLDQLITQIKGAIGQPEIVKHIYLVNTQGTSLLISVSDTLDNRTAKSQMDSIVAAEANRMERLIRYEAAGFTKMEAIPVQVAGSIPIAFALQGQHGFTIGALLLDMQGFITSNLAPKMQAISQDRFIISAFNKKNDSIIYSTESRQSAEEIRATVKLFKNESQKKEFWVLPGYYLGITMKGTSVDDLVANRTRISSVILSAFILMILGGVLFLYRNVKREMELSQAKSEFVSNVSHEIRTPLSLIGMFAETLEQGRVPTEEKKQEYYSIISKEAARLSRIVNRILNFSQLEARKKTFRFEPVQLNDVAKDIVNTYADHLREQGFTVEYSLGDLPELSGDRESIAEAIINLIDNAMKYSLDQKQIVLTSIATENGVSLAVKDHGMGIAREHHKHIFEQFYRTPSGDVHTTKGSGLGLALVRNIMRAHGGEVTVESSPGKGSIFRLHFPVNRKKNL